MPIIKVNGKYLQFKEGTPPEEIDRAIAAASGDGDKPQSAGQPSKEVTERARQRSMSRHAPSGFFGLPRGVFDQFTQGNTFNFADEIEGGLSAATRGTVNAIRKGSLSEIGKEYRTARDAARLDQEDYASQHKFGSTAAQLAGALVTPAAKLKGVDKLPAVARGAIYGTGYGAASGAGQAREISDVPRAVKNGAVGGAIFGGLLGGATNVIGGGVNAVRRQGEKEAQNVAYDRIAKALQDSPRYRGSQLRHTPESAAREIAVARGRGTDAALMDLSPEMQGLAGFVRRKPATGIQNDIYEFGAKRMEGRNNSFDAQVKESLTPTTGQDALARATQLKGAHKAEGANYERLVNEDVPINWSDDLNSLIYSDRPSMRSAIRAAYNRVKDEGLDPYKVGFERLDDGTLKITEAPTWRTMDYIRRSLGERAAMLRDKGARDAARAPDALYRDIREAMGKANPEYADMLSKQRSIFEKEEGLELGQSILQRINKEPRVVLQEINGLKADQLMDTRTGFVEKVLNVRNQKGNPVNSFKAMLENPDQRAVLAKMFGSSKNLNRFHKWLQRESRSARADTMTAGKQSITSDIMLMSDEAQSPTQELVTSGMHGVGFGGPIGGVGNVTRLLNRFKNHMSPAAMRELGKILMGDGKDIAQGVARSQAAKAARTRADIEAVRDISKLSGYQMGKELGK